MLFPEINRATSAPMSTLAIILLRPGLAIRKPPDEERRGCCGGKSEGFRTPTRLLAYWSN